MLLLAGDSLSAPDESGTIARVQRLSSLSGGVDVAIVFLLQSVAHQHDTGQYSGVAGLARLQAQLLSMADHSTIPVLTLANLVDLPKLLSTHMSALNGSGQARQSGPTALELLESCNAGSSLSPLAVSITSDLFSSLKDLALAAVAVWESVQNNSSPSRELSLTDASAATEDKAMQMFDFLEQQVGGDVVTSMIEFWADDWVVD